MLKPHITIRLSKHDDIVNRVDAYIEQMKFDIIKLPKDEQSTYWRDYNLIKDYVDNSHDAITDLVDELHPLPSIESIRDLHLTIHKLKRYIELLGGNPSIINYINLNDI